MSRQAFYTLLAIVCIKGVLFFVDSQPAYFLGDSEAYLATATAKYIPPDRSVLYGLLIRRIAYRAHSLEAMIVLQVAMSAIAAWLLYFALRNMFAVRPSLAALFGTLCSVEPLQLLAERYVLTESCANFLFVVHFVLALFYIRRGKLWALLAMQTVGVLLVGFRISFLPEVLITSVVVPLLSSNRRIGVLAAHLCLSLLVSEGLLAAYRHWYGNLIRREPALFYQEGAFLVAAFAPLIEPEDFPDSSKRMTIFGTLRYDRHDLFSRPAQHFVEGGLWPNIRQQFPDEKEANDLAVATAIHAVLRQPLGAVRLAWRTLLLYFDSHVLLGALLVDQGAEGGNHMDVETRGWLQKIYGISNPLDYQSSITKQWHLFAWPWYPAILCCLILSPLAFLARPKSEWRLVILSAMVALLFLQGAIFIVDRPTPRFLTSAAWIALLLLGLAANSVLEARSLRLMKCPSAPKIT